VRNAVTGRAATPLLAAMRADYDARFGRPPVDPASGLRARASL